MPGLFWAHYYQLPTPGLAVAVAVMLADAAAGARKRSWWRPAAALAAVALGAAVGGTAWLQVREYLDVPPEQLVKDKGGFQWVAQRALGRELARRSSAFPGATLFVWGWQGPLYFYSGYGHASRQVFVDDLLKHYAGRDHALIRPRVERIMRELRAAPPSVVFAAYPPFPELRALLEEHYVRSRVATGLWVERGRFEAFEGFTGR
jgi:hypothetical protein